MVGKESKMKNKFIRKWLVILTVAAMMIPAGIPANAETVEEGENIAPTAGISAETPNVTAETQKEEISAEMPDMTAETQNEEKSDVQAEGQNQAKQGVLEAVRQNTEKAEEASDAVDVQAEGKGRQGKFRSESRYIRLLPKHLQRQKTGTYCGF